MLHNPTCNGFATTGYVTSITATEFEILVAQYLQGLGKSLTKFKVKHNVCFSAHDGVYQIDVLASYKALGVNMMVLAECKRHNNPVRRDVVQVLNDKLHSTGAHKGIIFSTSGFQDGAIQYALRHKIALITVLPGKFLSVTNSIKNPTKQISTPQFIGELLTGTSTAYIHPRQIQGLIKFLVL